MKRERKRANGEILTVAAIHARYDSEWVLLENPEVDEQLNVIRGRVVCHSKDRDEVDRKAVALRLRHSAFLYTGKMPEKTAIVL